MGKAPRGSAARARAAAKTSTTAARGDDELTIDLSALGLEQREPDADEDLEEVARALACATVEDSVPATTLEAECAAHGVKLLAGSDWDRVQLSGARVCGVASQAGVAAAAYACRADCL